MCGVQGRRWLPPLHIEVVTVVSATTSLNPGDCYCDMTADHFSITKPEDANDPRFRNLLNVIPADLQVRASNGAETASHQQELHFVKWGFTTTICSL
jgi:hypothetical protein